MPLRRLIIVVAAVALVGGSLYGADAGANDKEEGKKDIWKDEPRRPRPWWNRDLSKETVERVLKGLRQRDAAKAKELDQLRKKDPELFKIKLREYGRPEFEQITRQYWENRRQRRNAEFLEWLKENCAADHAELAKLKDQDPTLYVKRLEHVTDEYSRIFEAGRSNPELGKVLIEDHALKKRREALRRRIRSEKSEAKRQKLGLELQEVVARRYDLIVRQKEIAYESLLQKLESLQKQIHESRHEIKRWKDDDLKRENVRQRIKSLTRGKVKFRWD
jgi:hypothetical protein